MNFFKNTESVTDVDEMIKILKENCEISKQIREKLKKFETINENDITLEVLNTDNIIEEKLTKEVPDIDYRYYYEPIKKISSNSSIEEIEKVIKESLPSKNNSNYYNLINRIKAEIYKEIIEYKKMLDELPNDKDFINDIKSAIEFEKIKLKIIDTSELEVKNEITKQQNDLYFLKTTSNNVYCINDLDKIDKEYYSLFKELILSIKNGTFKNIKRLTSTNDKLSSISEIKGFKTRVLFDKIGPNDYIILMCIVKKCNLDAGYKKALEDRTMKYRAFKDYIIYQLNDENYRNENKEIEKELFLKLENRGMK